MTIPIPKGLELPEVPEGETIVLPVTFEVGPEGLTPVAIDGNPVEAEAEEKEEKEAPPEKEGAPPEADFVSAVNKGLA